MSYINFTYVIICSHKLAHILAFFANIREEQLARIFSNILLVLEVQACIRLPFIPSYPLSSLSFYHPCGADPEFHRGAVTPPHRQPSPLYVNRDTVIPHPPSLFLPCGADPAFHRGCYTATLPHGHTVTLIHYPLHRHIPSPPLISLVEKILGSIVEQRLPVRVGLVIVSETHMNDEDFDGSWAGGDGGVADSAGAEAAAQVG